LAGSRKHVDCTVHYHDSKSTIARLLRPLGYSLKTNVKRLIGKQHPQRDKQYRFIGRVKARFIRRGQPIISVDAKKLELIGNFKNSGRRLCKEADEVNTYDRSMVAMPWPNALS
jgi:hypothetical protein